MTSSPLVPVEPMSVDELDDELCLYRADVDEVLVLNPTAADIWRLIDGTVTADDIVAILTVAYAADPVRVRSDVERTIADLQDRGFVMAPALP